MDVAPTHSRLKCSGLYVAVLLSEKLGVITDAKPVLKRERTHTVTCALRRVLVILLLFGIVPGIRPVMDLPSGEVVMVMVAAVELVEVVTDLATMIGELEEERITGGTLLGTVGIKVDPE